MKKKTWFFAGFFFISGAPEKQAKAHRTGEKTGRKHA